MATESKLRKRVYTLATAIGLALGSMGIASAATQPAQPLDATQIEAPADVTEVDAPGDEDLDGVNHEFEGEEIGNNGDGIPDADEADEAGDDDLDGGNHEFEGEEIGNNGDGIPDADEASEADEVTTTG